MPPDGDVKKPPFRIHQTLRDDGSSSCGPFDGESGETEHATAVGQRHPIEPTDDAFEVGGELEEVAEPVDGGLADLVEGAARSFRRREAESVGDGAVRSCVGEAEESSAELDVSGNGKVRLEGRVKRLKESAEGSLRHAEGLGPSDIVDGGGGQEAG